jgi:hypothetical protein
VGGQSHVPSYAPTLLQCNAMDSRTWIDDLEAEALRHLRSLLPIDLRAQTPFHQRKGSFQRPPKDARLSRPYAHKRRMSRGGGLTAGTTPKPESELWSADDPPW